MYVQSKGENKCLFLERNCEPCLDDVGEIFLPLIRAERSGSLGDSNIQPHQELTANKGITSKKKLT